MLGLHQESVPSRGRQKLPPGLTAQTLRGRVVPGTAIRFRLVLSRDPVTDFPERSFFMAVTLIAFAVGALLLWQGWSRQQKVKASMAWPYVPGRVMAASVRQVVERGDAQTRDGTTYVPLVQYEYQVGSQIYQGNRFAFRESSYSSHKKAFKVVDAFPAGHPVWVFFDPAN